jgi:hypothetical protein
MRQPPGRPGACGVNLFHARDVQRVEGLRAHGAIKLRHMADGKRALQRQRGAVVRIIGTEVKIAIGAHQSAVMRENAQHGKGAGPRFGRLAPCKTRTRPCALRRRWQRPIHD